VRKEVLNQTDYVRKDLMSNSFCFCTSGFEAVAHAYVDRILTILRLNSLRHPYTNIRERIQKFPD